MIEYKPVQSSNLQEVGYDPETWTMRVKFTNGTEYEYPGTSQEAYESLMNSHSKGSYFSANFKHAHTKRLA